MIYTSDKDPSYGPKTLIALSMAAALAICAWFLFYSSIDDEVMFGWLTCNGSMDRRFLIFLFLAVYMARTLVSLFVFLKRMMLLTEALAVAAGMVPVFLIYAIAGGKSQEPMDRLDYFGISLYVLGSFIHTAAEFSRYVWKKKEENSGNLYTHGLFSLSMHVNYFGDLLIFSGLAIITFNLYMLLIPLFMGVNFLVFIIPAHDDYLIKRYKDKFINYARNTKRLIPFVY